LAFTGIAHRDPGIQTAVERWDVDAALRTDLYQRLRAFTGAHGTRLVRNIGPEGAAALALSRVTG
jgi:hypothetical protein